MISGTSFADFAVLAVDSSPNALEKGLFGGGQTREHASLAKSLGVEKVIIAVNKMDVCRYSRYEFERVKGLLSPVLKGLGFKEKSLTWIPVSGLLGENLGEKAKDPLLTEW